MYADIAPPRHTLNKIQLSRTGADGNEPRKPVTSIAGSNRCLWPPDSTFLTMSNQFKEPVYHAGAEGVDDTVAMASSSSLISKSTVPTMHQFKNHPRSDSFQDAGKPLMDWQPCRKARRVVDGPYSRERNNSMVTDHVRKLIQEAVEDGVGELDLSNLELTDLPSDISDLNFAIVYSERGSFSLTRNRLKLFLSSNQFTKIPMSVFALHNLSVLSLRNNNIETIPPEIGQLHNLVELSLGGNLLKTLPSQIVSLPKLHILTIHPNPFMKPSPSPDPRADYNTTLEEARLQHTNHPVLSGSNNNLGPSLGMPLFQEILPINLNEEPSSSNSLGLDTSMSDNDIMDAIPSSQDSSSSATTNASAESSSTMNTDPDLSTSLDISGGPPTYKVTKSRFPTLLILAGNVLLNHMDQQEKSTGMTKDASHTMGRQRKDSKITVEGDEFPQDGMKLHQSTGQSWPDDALESQVGVTSRKRVVFKEATIKSYMTPYLFDIFMRARAINRCAGCQRKFWKSCRTLVIWQDFLGQTQVPIEWKGCGIENCPGVPASIWSPASVSSISCIPDSSAAVAAAASGRGEEPLHSRSMAIDAA
ncbi:hypothetical protein BGZ51_000210 [Haplosporangium sp. Z 767]|nr:hypothetical protein BGZ51_000210 [Haplosporangium sp. Z 767]